MPQGNSNLAPEIDPIPLPQEQQVRVRTAADSFQQPPAEPSAYYGSKAGGVADVANHVLTGWMAGKWMGEQKAREKARDKMGTLASTEEEMGKVYRAAVESGDQGRIDSAYKMLQNAYDSRTEAMKQYVMPEDDGKKKGVGGKIKAGAKAMFGPEHPQFFAQAALAAREQMSKDKNGLASLYGPSKAEQRQEKLDDLNMQSLERKNKQDEHDQQARDRWEKILNTPEKDLKAEDKKFRDTYEHIYLNRTKEDVFKDQIFDSVTSGKQLNEFERTKAEQMGLIKPAVTNTQIRTVMGPKGQPQTQLVAIGPDGKMVGTPQTLPGNEYVPPDQAQIAGRVINSEASAYVSLLRKANIGKDDQERYAMALGQIAKGTQLDYAMQSHQQSMMNTAILKLIKDHSAKHFDKSTGQTTNDYDPMGTALMNHFVTSDDNGAYRWNASLGDKTDPSWWDKLWGDKSTYGGYTEEQLKQYDNMIRAELRRNLKEENKHLTDAQIDQMMPQAGFGQAAPKQGQAAGDIAKPPEAPAQKPKQGAPENTPQGAPPGMGQQIYSVTTSEGAVQRPMTPEQAEALKARGVRVMLVGGSTP